LGLKGFVAVVVVVVEMNHCKVELHRQQGSRIAAADIRAPG
jgi:hypothetical protein